MEKENEEIADLDELKDRVKTFRKTNIELANQNNSLQDQIAEQQASFEERFTAIETERNQAQETGQKKESQLETLARQVQELQDANAEKDKAVSAEKQKNKNVRIETELTKAFLEAGATPKGASDAAVLGKSGWDEQEGKLVLRQNDQLVYSEVAAGEPISVHEYAQQFLTERPHFSAASMGDNKTAGLGSKMINGKPAIPNDPKLLGRYADKINSGEMDVYIQEK